MTAFAVIGIVSSFLYFPRWISCNVSKLWFFFTIVLVMHVCHEIRKPIFLYIIAWAGYSLL